MSFASVQIYDNYLSLYTPKKSTRFDKHDRKELTDIYGRILDLNRQSPFYMLDTTTDTKRFAVQLKESAREFSHSIASLGGTESEALFSRKSAYSNNESIATIEYNRTEHLQTSNSLFELRVKELATPQRNTGAALPSEEPVKLESDSYSFDIDINHVQYELQFHIKEDETNEQLQNKIAKLINRSDFGLEATVKTYAQDMTYLEITSHATGLPPQRDYHFKISDNHTSYKTGIVNYLGLNKEITPATNATYEINGVEHTSYSNTFTLEDAYEVTLHNTNNAPDDEPVIIGLAPDSESINHNIQEFVDSYNSFMTITTDYQDAQNIAATRLRKEMHYMLLQHEERIKKYGITANEDGSLSFEPQDTPAEPEALRKFGNHILAKMDSISLNPMEYVNKKVCAYKHPSNTFIIPYVTSAYSGMLFNMYC
ncbi:MAG: flagellar filament capping protein FliD [Lachnospiraceae bacterium]|nr:flagellar filament capping protein FliD [Lachnospiraceae bacterium]